MPTHLNEATNCLSMSNYLSKSMNHKVIMKGNLSVNDQVGGGGGRRVLEAGSHIHTVNTPPWCYTMLFFMLNSYGST